MGAPPQSLLHSLNVKGMILHKKGTSSINSSNTSPNMNGSSLWSKILEAQRAKSSQTKPRSSQSSSKKAHVKSRNRSRVFAMKRNGRRVVRREGGGSRSSNGIERRVRTLKRLVPTRESDDGLDVLFRDTAAYIMSLQMRVRVMQIMVDVLDASQDHH